MDNDWVVALQVPKPFTSGFNVGQDEGSKLRGICQCPVNVGLRDSQLASHAHNQQYN